jgi:Flp pilus assembly protein TadD
MDPLTPPDTHHLSSAMGWLGLGLPADAEGEIQKIKHGNQSHPDVLEVRWQIAAKKEDWSECLNLANSMWAVDPDRPSSWINRAYSLRRVRGGGLIPAQECLLHAQALFPNVMLIAFNLACYACQLGDLNTARALLKKSARLTSEALIKKMVLRDEDLKPLWEEYSPE